MDSANAKLEHLIEVGVLLTVIEGLTRDVSISDEMLGSKTYEWVRKSAGGDRAVLHRYGEAVLAERCSFWALLFRMTAAKTVSALLERSPGAKDDDAMRAVYTAIGSVPMSDEQLAAVKALPTPGELIMAIGAALGPHLASECRASRAAPAVWCANFERLAWQGHWKK